MSSAPFSRFKRQYYSTGRERADGYSIQDLEQLDAEERATAEDMLVKALEDIPDPRSPIALVVLDSDRGYTRIKNVLPEAPDRFRPGALYALWSFEQDGKYIDQLIGGLSSDAWGLRNEYLTYLLLVPCSRSVVDALYCVVESDTHSILRSRAMTGLAACLDWVQPPPMEENQREALVRSSYSNDSSSRATELELLRAMIAEKFPK